MAIDNQGALWLACYGFGAAYRVVPDGKITHKISTEQKGITNIRFGRGAEHLTLYLTGSDLERVTGYVYRAQAPVPGAR